MAGPATIRTCDDEETTCHPHGSARAQGAQQSRATLGGVEDGTILAVDASLTA